MPQPDLIDAISVHHSPAPIPARIVSLVPSITELLFDLGLGEQVVGRTRYCLHPADRIASTPSVGGTKKIKHRVLRALNPTHVIVNVDENSKAMVEEIAAYAPNIIVTHPLAPEDNVEIYRLLGGIFHRRAEAEELNRRFLEALDAARSDRWPRRPVIYLIWRKPWMTVARDTYISRTLALVGWETLPETSAQRYPVLAMEPSLVAKAELILFSSEPYPFGDRHLTEFSRQYGCPPGKLALIDGEMTSWYGSRAIAGLYYLRRFAAAHDGHSVDYHPRAATETVHQSPDSRAEKIG